MHITPAIHMVRVATSAVDHYMVRGRHNNKFQTNAAPVTNQKFLVDLCDLPLVVSDSQSGELPLPVTWVQVRGDEHVLGPAHQ